MTVLFAILQHKASDRLHRKVTDKLATPCSLACRRSARIVSAHLQQRPLERSQRRVIRHLAGSDHMLAKGTSKHVRGAAARALGAIAEQGASKLAVY